MNINRNRSNTDCQDLTHSVNQTESDLSGGASRSQKTTVLIFGKVYKIYVKMKVDGEAKFVTVKQAQKILARKQAAALAKHKQQKGQKKKR